MHLFEKSNFSYHNTILNSMLKIYTFIAIFSKCLYNIEI